MFCLPKERPLGQGRLNSRCPVLHSSLEPTSRQKAMAEEEVIVCKCIQHMGPRRGSCSRKWWISGDPGLLLKLIVRSTAASSAPWSG